MSIAYYLPNPMMNGDVGKGIISTSEILSTLYKMNISRLEAALLTYTHCSEYIFDQ
jgi:Na+/citrate or Na+/malate symporter